MLKKIMHLAILAFCLTWGPLDCARQESRQGTDTTHRATGAPLNAPSKQNRSPETSPKTINKPASLEYLEIFTGSRKKRSDASTVIALHGLGDTPENFAAIFQSYRRPARFVIPRAPIPYGPGFAWFLTRLEIGKMDVLGREIATAAEQVISLVRTLRTPKPPIICGFSQGGMISFAVAIMSPKATRASIPISGLLPPSLLQIPPPNAKMHPMIHALHGASDSLVPLSHAQSTVQRIRSLGMRADLEVFENTPHTISLPMQTRLFALLDRYLSDTPELQ